MTSSMTLFCSGISVVQSRNSGLRTYSPGAGVKDCALSVSVAGLQNQRRCRYQHIRSVKFCAGKTPAENPDASIRDAPGDQHSPIVEEGGRVDFSSFSHIARREKDPR